MHLSGEHACQLLCQVRNVLIEVVTVWNRKLTATHGIPEALIEAPIRDPPAEIGLYPMIADGCSAMMVLRLETVVGSDPLLLKVWIPTPIFLPAFTTLV